VRKPSILKNSFPETQGHILTLAKGAI
jgi:hypothetical protein